MSLADPTIHEDLLELISRLHDGDILSHDEKARLESALRESEGARSLYVRYGAMQAILESDAETRQELITGRLPENVVPLPGAVPFLPESVPHGEEKTAPTRPGRIHRFAAAAAAVIALTGLAFLLAPNGDDESGVFTGPGDERSENDPAAVQQGEINDSKGADRPEEIYGRSLLATVDSGSENRPPSKTQLVNADTIHGEISYNRDIRPILSDNCFACHGPDSSSRKADLRLDREDSAVENAIVRGEPEKSELFTRINHHDPDEMMPPPDSHKKLTERQVKLVRRWILEGAEFEDHWAFIPPVKPELPEVESDWVRNEIDRFILARLTESGIPHAETADRHALIRRVTLDLTGLPPTIEEIEAFIAEESDGAWEKLIDRLLKSKGFGEERARYWLDAARYGDTHGLHLDNYREIWPWRDWVIGSFNDNMPFDRFTIEQLAGDLLPDANQWQRVATGFNRCNVTTSEGGAIAEEFLVRYAVDRVNTTSTVWMGITSGCAQCHDHKYDPLTMKEFYRLFAFFNNTTQPGMDGNSKESPPVIRVFPSEKEEVRAGELKKGIASADAELKKMAKAGEADFQEWLKSVSLKTVSSLRLADEQVFEFEKAASAEPVQLPEVGGFEASKPFTVSFRYKVPDEDGRLVLLGNSDPENNGRGWRVVWENWGINIQLIESWPGKILRTGVTRRVRPGASGHFAISYDGSSRSEGIRLYMNGQRLQSRFVNEWADTLSGDFHSKAPFRVGGSSEENAKLFPDLNEVRLFDRKLTDAEVKSLNGTGKLIAIGKKPVDKWTDAEKGQVREAWLQSIEENYRRELVRKSEAERELSAIETRSPYTLVMQEKDGEEPFAHILERGEYDKPTEKVKPGVPEFLPAFAAGQPANRLGLATWLTNANHPLTARVTVNRVWQEIFGLGLVKTSEDFGTQGEAPSHPELLDWLAVSFVESGWDLKQLYKTILMSATYRQSSNVRSELAEYDPQNRLLARGARYRLDAETIRDQALFASGLLDSKVGGPSVKPWQPGGIWQVVGYTNSNTQTFYQDYGAAEHRRTLYTFWKRTAPPPNMTILDAPNREDCVVRRERTNTPLQALVLMNDPQFVRASRHLALRVINERQNVDARLDYLALVLLGRPMSAEEKAVLKKSLSEFQRSWAESEKSAREFLTDEINPAFSLASADNPAELASWALVASQIINLDESVNRN